MKRIALFILTNILVITTISILLRILGLDNYMTANGINYPMLFGFCLVWGMVGSFISLMLSKVMAKWTMGIQVVDKTNPQYSALVSMVENLSRTAGLSAMPEVGVYNSPEMNAFATGPSQRNSLVAFSTGLLQSMTRDEIEGVAAHEIAHIRNGDMVTMTLLQGVINAFVMFFARAIAFAVSQNVKEGSRALVQMLVVIVLQIVFGMLGMLVIAAFSRAREFRADKGAAQYAGKADMIAALKRLQVGYKPYDKTSAVSAFKIAGGFATHPPLEARIAALEKLPR